MSMMVVNNDGYVNKGFHGAGAHKLTMKEFNTPYVVLAVRTLVNASNEANVKLANALQDKMKIEAASAKPFVMPDYDMDSYNATYKPLLELAKGLPDPSKTFGSKTEGGSSPLSTRISFWVGRTASQRGILSECQSQPAGRRVSGHGERRAGRSVLVNQRLQQGRLVTKE
jgi:hypothetical protein